MNQNKLKEMLRYKLHQQIEKEILNDFYNKQKEEDMKINFRRPKAVNFSSGDNETVNELETGKHGRSIYRRTVAIDPVCDNEREILNNHDMLVEERAFGPNAPYTVSKKGFDKYSVDTGETRRGLRVKIEMEIKEF